MPLLPPISSLQNCVMPQLSNSGPQIQTFDIKVGDTVVPMPVRSAYEGTTCSSASGDMQMSPSIEQLLLAQQLLHKSMQISSGQALYQAPVSQPSYPVDLTTQLQPQFVPMAAPKQQLQPMMLPAQTVTAQFGM